MLFVTYFPHLIAGPIIHHKEMMPQFARADAYRFDPGNFALGISAFTIGLAKKVLIADHLVQFAAPVFAVASRKAVLFYESWIGALAYTLQLYFDFSGYCDMAIGVSLLFGIKLPINFNSPYRARDISDFWRRWHITLYRWFNEYLFTPLAVAMRDFGKAGVIAAILLTFTLSGLWHGASWTFVAWGAVHGAYLCIHYLWRRTAVAAACARRRAWSAASWALTFVGVVAAFVFFRSATFDTALRMLQSMFDLRGALNLPEQIEPYLGPAAGALRQAGFEFRFGSVPLILQGPVWIVPLLLIVWFAPNTQELLGGGRIALTLKASLRPSRALAWRPSAAWTCAVGLLLALCVLSLQNAGEFLYYQF
jgi:D-alanyl-lipoteichoic acid acyltransferase DltB (MBOAT superfamily)